MATSCTTPADMTLDHARRFRPASPRRRLRPRPYRTPEGVRHLALVPDTPCDHQQEAMTRHNLAKKLLTFVLVCPVCETEKVVHTVPYEPTFERPPRLAA